MPLGPDVPLGEVIYFDVTTHVASTGAISDADSTPSFAVYEEGTDTDIGVGGNLTKRTSLTGDYRGSFTTTSGNGFEVGKWYSIIVSATVSSIAAKQCVGSFRICAAEAIAGKAKADVDGWNGTAVATPDTAGYPKVTIKDGTGDGEIDTAAGGVSLSTAGLAALTAAFGDAIAAAIIAEFAISGSAASAGATLQSSDVDVFNQALDLLKEAPITTFTDTDRDVAAWGLRNYIPSRNAELREHPWKFAIKRATLYPYDFVLHGITATLTGAWAPFRLNEKWSGDLVTIRRDSDDTTDDFGLATTTDDNGDTVFDDKIELDADSVATFVGSGSGYVSKLYDQSGNGNDISQATTGKQPLYVAEVGDNTRVGVSFDGSNDILASTVAMTSLMSVSTGYMLIAGLIDAATLDSATKTSNHLLMGDASSKLGMYVRKGGTLYGVNDDGSLDAGIEAAPLYVPFVAELRHESGIVYLRINGGDEDSATSGDTSSLSGVLNIGDLSAGSHALDFKMFAALTFSTVPTLAERDRMVERLLRTIAAPGHKDFGWDYRYPQPDDCIRILPLTADGEFEGRPIKHVVEKGYVLCDQGTSIKVRYIQTFSDASRFDPLFVEALAARMATKMAHWLTGKASMIPAASAAYNTAVEKATMANALEGSQERPADEEPIDARYDALGVR